MLKQIDNNEVNKLSFRKNGEKYLLYKKAIEPYIKEIDNNIAKSENGFYRIGEKTLRSMLGEHLKNNGSCAIRQALKYIFWKFDIVVEMKARVDGKKNFYFRRKCESDVFPPFTGVGSISYIDNISG